MGFFELFAAALTALYAVVRSYGLAIILLTLLVRLLLLPLSIKQTRSMREMQRIQPEIKKIQAKYKGNRQKMNEELMKLYQEHQVNPFGGCLPLLLQLPVLIGLFYVLRSPLRYMGFSAPAGVNFLNEFRPRPGLSGLMQMLQSSSLAQDLATAGLKVNQFLGLRLDCHPSDVLAGRASDTVAVSCGSGLVSALPYLALVLLMGYTTYYQQRQMQASAGTSSPQAQQMQIMTRVLPVMLMIFSFNFPTGLVIYWITTNLWTIGQQRIILRVAPPVTPGAPASTKRKAKGNAGAKGADGAGGKAGKAASDGAGGVPVRAGQGSKKKKR
jgi:YidC/Oxa1 family membrane protein insertase